MFAEFRRHYPLGSLQGELLRIEEGIYIVRVAVQVGGMTLATAMAAGPTVEAAEDAAQERALVTLGLTPTPVSLPPLPPPLAPAAPEPLPLPLPMAELEPEMPRPRPIPESRNGQEKSPRLPPKTPAAVPPVDIAEVLVGTTAEMQRLGWTDQQGREHLERTYGKRSRHQLTNEELLDFLGYLRAQSGLTPPPF
ncbi:MAG: hypothetical protein IGQ88_04200 [Gloeomargaritaceae cyanobacterium C42_A2020_066]|nr:hypothetical protein [Gloeomargaritaceae cyanobacterium C42_A2020_066]